MTRDGQKVFASGDALRFGWQKTMANLKPLLTIGAVAIGLGLLNRALSGDEGPRGLASLFVLLIQLVQIGVTMVFVHTALKLHDGQPAELSRLGEVLGHYFSFLLTAVLYALIVAVGLVFLIVPGIIWALKFGFATFLVVDRHLDPIAALRESSRLTQGEKGQLFGFALLLFVMNLLGALALGVGLLVTIPTSYLAGAYILRRLQASAPVRIEPTIAETPTITPPTPLPSS